MFRIRKSRNFSLLQLAVVCGIGIFGGAYIYQPLLLKYIKGGNKPTEETKLRKGTKKK